MIAKLTRRAFGAMVAAIPLTILIPFKKPVATQTVSYYIKNENTHEWFRVEEAVAYGQGRGGGKNFLPIHFNCRSEIG